MPDMRIARPNNGREEHMCNAIEAEPTLSPKAVIWEREVVPPNPGMNLWIQRKALRWSWMPKFIGGWLREAASSRRSWHARKPTNSGGSGC